MKKIILHPFPYPLYIAFGEKDFPAFHRVMWCHADYTLEEASKSDASTHRPSHNDRARLGVWFHQGALSRPRDHVLRTLPGVISHEAHHVLAFIDEMIGEHQRTDELHAYLLQSIVNDIWQEWLRITKTKAANE